MKKIKVCWLLSVCLLSGLSYPSFLLAEETTITLATELTGDALYEQGFNLINQEKYQSAITYFEEAVKRKSNFADAYYQLGICYLKTKQFEKAKQNLSFAKILSQNGKTRSEATALLVKIPEENEKYKNQQKDASSFFEQGQVYYNSKNYEGALNYFTKALNIYPAYPEALLARGKTYFNIGDYNKAIADYTQVLNYQPNNAEVYVIRGIAYGNVGISNLKDNDFKKALGFDPKIVEDYRNTLIEEGREFYIQKDFNKAIYFYSFAIDLNPNDEEIYIKRGVVYGYVNKPDLKDNDFKKALELNPKLVENIADRGYAYYNNRDYDLALNEFNTGILIDPSNIRCNYALGLTYLQKAEGENAIAYNALACFEKVIKLDPNAKESKLAGNLMEKINLAIQEEKQAIQEQKEKQKQEEEKRRNNDSSRVVIGPAMSPSQWFSHAPWVCVFSNH